MRTIKERLPATCVTFTAAVMLIGSALVPNATAAIHHRSTTTKPPAPMPMPALRSVPSPIYGMTQDNVANVNSIVDMSSHLAHMPTNRIVFDEGVSASSYTSAIAKLRPSSYIMGQILDSSAVKKTSTQAYHDRVASYLSTLGTNVDIWEVGNEVNGDWLGSAASVTAKISDAYDQTKAKGYSTALTLYYNPNCWAKSSNEMFKWAAANIPQRMKDGLDYLLVSYYEQDCNGFQPTTAQWQVVFDRLHAMFPNSKLGFGEVGTHPKSTLAYKTDTMQRYYGMPITTPGYIGGYFWWYAYEDLAPYNTKPLWATLNDEIQTY